MPERVIVCNGAPAHRPVTPGAWYCKRPSCNYQHSDKTKTIAEYWADGPNSELPPTFSSAGATILHQFTGSDAFGASYTQLAGTSRVEPGTTPASNVTLSWPTFTAAAMEAALSRRYGGIHFLPGDDVARAMWLYVAQQAWNKTQTYISGKSGSHGGGGGD
jgi:hypothetical protein